MWLVAFSAAAGCPVSFEERRTSAALVAALVSAEVSNVRAMGLEIATIRDHAVPMPFHGVSSRRQRCQATQQAFELQLFEQSRQRLESGGCGNAPTPRN